jgi:chemotaxis protein histidine kinase CheA
MGRTNRDKLSRTPTKPTQNETQNITPANNKTDSKESEKGEKKHMSDQESDEARSKRARKAQKEEEQKNKAADKALSVHMEEMKCMIAHVEQGVEKRITEHLAEQTSKYDEDLEALKQSQAAMDNMFTNPTPTRIISYKAAYHYNNMTKASDVLFDGKPKKRQVFEDHLTKEASNPIIGWSKYILSFQIIGKGPIINLLETYFNIPPNMIVGLQNYLKDTTKGGGLNNLDTKLYKLKSLKTKLRNCLTHSFGDHIEESMPMDISNNYGRMYFCLIISHTFQDKDTHKEFINNYSLELKITKLNSMKSFQ